VSLITLSNGTTFEADAGVSILDAALAKGVVLEHSCRTGRCGSCKARVVGGLAAGLREPLALTSDEAADNWVLTCTHEAITDVHLDIEDLGALSGIEERMMPTRIDSLELLSDDVMRIGLRLPPRSTLRFLAGQYIDVTSPSGVKRSYSIAIGGQLSAYWFEQAQVNDLLRFHGPRGTFFLRPVVGLDLIFLATGTGIAPIRSMLLQLADMPIDERPRTVSLYWGGRHPKDLYLDPSDLFGGLRYVPVLSRGDSQWLGSRGYIQDVVVNDVAHQILPTLSDAAVYACGSETMIHEARGLLIDNGLPINRFYFDAFVSSN